MASKARKSSGKAGSRAGKRSTSKRPTAKSSRGKAAASKRSNSRRSATAAQPKSKRSASSPAKKSAHKGQKKSRVPAPIARVTRVAKEVAQQATSAVTGGVEAIKEMGESLVERVTG